MAEKNWKAHLKKAVPRLLKAAVLSIVFYFVVYCISSLASGVESFFSLYRPLTDFFTIIFILLLFAAELSYGTVFYYAFNFAKTFVFIIYLVYVLNGGVLDLSIPVQGQSLDVMVDVRILLTVLIFVFLLGLSKNVLQAVEFLLKKTTEQQVTENSTSIELKT